MTRWTQHLVLIATIGVVCTAAGPGAPAVAAGATLLEPNNSIVEASGPLETGVTYNGSIAPSGDRDFYFFYISAPRVTGSVALQNLGGGPAGSAIDLTILDPSANPLAAQAFIRAGETRSATVSLGAGKYFVEVAEEEGNGDSYLLIPGSEMGAFTPYGDIAAKCANARRRITVAEAAVQKEEGRLQRAIAARRRARFSGRDARRIAARRVRKARSRLNAVKKALTTARGSSQPWCAISR